MLGLTGLAVGGALVAKLGRAVLQDTMLLQQVGVRSLFGCCVVEAQGSPITGQHGASGEVFQSGTTNTLPCVCIAGKWVVEVGVGVGVGWG